MVLIGRLSLMEGRFLTVWEVAKILRLHPASIRKAVREGKIPGARRVPGGRLIRIPTAFVEDQR
jgi:excisionase family DNA binding protein